MLLPIGDDNPERMAFPIVTLLLIAANILVFLLEVSRGEAFLIHYSLIPAAFFHGQQPIFNLFSSMFLHGGFAHIFGNMLYLYIFGDNVEDNLGKVKFFLFYMLCGVAAMLAQALAIPDSTVPNIGASGAIAGVLAAYLILYPRNRIRVLIFFPFTMTMSAWFVLGLWIATQLLSGWTSTYHHAATAQGGIAYMAHVGGFFTGVILTFVFRRHEAKQGTMHRLGMR
ncbi:MAG: rhomboid family intramembrane serine protease [Bacteroidota bacterium]|nr:rhomboid family intramembrane serine protease [Bacteroidota bacterium]MDP4233807.1 rhomboid family intramembrane serine protease [Bacteroidota bacterium]MDP4242446.1 rhomboid family intramembrane serine protease [Bacteroidota bacterium]MDP4287568.1 rhomboid family intramembrane serine protease [Bacteroidota bacterium]